MQTIRKFLRPSKARSADCSRAVSAAGKLDSMTLAMVEASQQKRPFTFLPHSYRIGCRWK